MCPAGGGVKGDELELAARHEQFSVEHASAMELCRLYNQDMLNKARRIEDQAVEMRTRWENQKSQIKMQLLIMENFS